MLTKGWEEHSGKMCSATFDTLADLGSDPDSTTGCVTLCTLLTSLGLSTFIYRGVLLTLT